MKGKQVTFVGAYVCCVRVSYAYYTMAIRVVLIRFLFSVLIPSSWNDVRKPVAFRKSVS
jgi:hypothetical protein